MKESVFASIVHPSSVIASTVKHKQGLYVEPLSVISAYATVGFGVSINRHCSVGHHNVLHDYCSIYPGSHLAGDVKIGRAATIGPGTAVFSGVAVGEKHHCWRWQRGNKRYSRQRACFRESLQGAKAACS